MNATDDVIIIGGGLAGLCCARVLHASGVPFLLLEASDDIGGRVRTDTVDGFLLDRGFQVLLEAYPEAQDVLDYAALDLRRFYPGALVRQGNKFRRMADPFRKPIAGVRSLFGGVGSVGDKLRVLRLRREARAGAMEDLFRRDDQTAREALERIGMSREMIDGFFRPWLGGVFLDTKLETTSRMLHFVMRNFAEGETSVPAKGMSEIPKQIAAGLPASSIRLNTRVSAVEPGRARLETGEVLEGRATVVATEGATASRLLGRPRPHGDQGTVCFYFDADRDPVGEPILVLDGDGKGPVNNLCVPSAVSPAYAPKGRSLVSVSVIGHTGEPEAELLERVRHQLEGWYGDAVQGWRLLRSYKIPHALPTQPVGALDPSARPPARVDEGIYVCGDHVENASINGAMVSGRRAAETLIEDLGLGGSSKVA
ncbi:MAG: NAD(P)/FAD-dependent oxidoreductase [Planctomycetota bacterium]|nr:NAD(P)/FAD-dependent oxidoreductase [Planctomycetota bacterium]